MSPRSSEGRSSSAPAPSAEAELARTESDLKRFRHVPGVDNNNQDQVLLSTASSCAGVTQDRFVNNRIFEGKVALLSGSASIKKKLALSFYV